MLRKLLKNKKAQNTAEYAILISLVVAGIIAMQTYAQRALQGRVRDASQYMVDQTSTEIGGTKQYEPYYLDTEYNVQTTDDVGEVLVGNNLSKTTDNLRTRLQDGRRITSYSANMFGVDANGV